MKRLVLLLALLASPAWAVTDRYIDGGCTNNGDGTALTCASGAGAAGPWNRIQNATLACDTTYHVRGRHATHGSDHAAGTFDGRYFGNEWAITTNCGGSGAQTWQPYQYGTGSQEITYLDGTRCPSAGTYSNTGAAASCGSGTGWTQCTWDGTCDCDAAHQNVTIGAGGSGPCTETWWTTDNGTAGTGFQSGGANRVMWAQKDDGSITFSVGSLAAMTNATSGYVSGRCTNTADSTQTYKPCSVNADCTGGETCTASSAEIDSFRDNAGTVGTYTDDVLFVRWGTGAQAPGTAKRPYIVYLGAGTGFTLKASSAQNITIRGFDFRAHARAAVYSDGGTNCKDNTVDDVRNFFIVGPTDEQAGSDYGFTAYSTNNHTIKNSEIAYTVSEAIHCNSQTGSTVSIVTMLDNYIHNIGDVNVLGPKLNVTPVGITCNSQEDGNRVGIYTGSTIKGNVIRDVIGIPGVQTSTYGIRLEHCSTGMVVRDNVLLRAGTQQGILIDASGNCNGVSAVTSADDVFNNLIIDQGADCFRFYADTGETVDDIDLYNNTCIDPGANGGIYTEVVLGTITNVRMRNNLLSTGSLKGINWTETEGSQTNVFENNLIKTSANPAGTFEIAGATVSKACSALSDFGSGNINNCPDPVFVNTSADDYHLQTSSPAKDAGTTRCCSSTADINNTLAGSHGMPSYADNQACSGTCDIGADEFIASAVRKIMVVTGG